MKATFLGVLGLACALVAPVAAAQDLDDRCISLLDGFRPYSLVPDSGEIFAENRGYRERAWQKLADPIDLDQDGVLERVYIMAGYAPQSYRIAWNALVLVQPGKDFKSDGQLTGFVKDLTRGRETIIGYVRARLLTHMQRDFKLVGPAAETLPRTRHVLAELGELEGQPGLKLRIEPYMAEYDPNTGKIIGDRNVRYLALARFKDLDTMDVQCVWKMTAAPVVAPDRRD